jgi:hypothetical protein
MIRQRRCILTTERDATAEQRDILLIFFSCLKKQTYKAIKIIPGYSA